MRHIGAVVVQLDLDVCDRRDDTGRRGRRSIDQVEPGLPARHPSIFDGVVEFAQSLQLLCGYIEIVEVAADVNRCIPDSGGLLALSIAA